MNDDFVITHPGDWCDLYGKDFSGTCTYKVNFNFEKIPEIIEMCFKPFKFTVDGNLLKKENEMRITVSNTTANQVCATKSFDEIPKHIMGPYHSIVKEFEYESIPSGLLSHIKIYY